MFRTIKYCNIVEKKNYQQILLLAQVQIWIHCSHIYVRRCTVSLIEMCVLSTRFTHNNTTSVTIDITISHKYTSKKMHTKKSHFIQHRFLFVAMLCVKETWKKLARLDVFYSLVSSLQIFSVLTMWNVIFLYAFIALYLWDISTLQSFRLSILCKI